MFKHKRYTTSLFHLKGKCSLIPVHLDNPTCLVARKRPLFHIVSLYTHRVSFYLMKIYKIRLPPHHYLSLKHLWPIEQWFTAISRATIFPIEEIHTYQNHCQSQALVAHRTMITVISMATILTATTPPPHQDQQTMFKQC